jgi:dTDP-4-amino-4,6-dideoxy-D-galactose acyltransferase
MRLTLLDWDSAFFSKRLARIESGPLTEDGLARLVNAGKEAAVQGFVHLADPTHVQSLRALERHQFELMDVRVELEVQVGARPSVTGVRDARSGDLDSLVAIARASHRNTRFHVDPHFGSERASELYAVWIERSVRGEIADVVLVPELNGRVVGYLALSERDDHAAQITLIAVQERYRSQGVGAQLMAAAHQWCVKHHRTVLQVATTGRSAASLRFYEREGFVSRKIGLWYHLWA